MRRRLRIPILAFAILLLSRPAAAVDASGTWAISFMSDGVSCESFSGTLVATTTTFELTAFYCTVSGTIDPMSGTLTATSAFGYCGINFHATATDTLITGGFDFPQCFGYTFFALRACAACDDGNPCSTDGCSAPNSPPGCFYALAPPGTPCDDGNPSTTHDACAYTGSASNYCSGMTCNDNNPCTDDTNNGFACVFTPNTDPCDDGDSCTSGDHCSAGVCGGLGCARCESCSPSGCVVAPSPGCRPSHGGGKIMLRDAVGSAQDQLAWSWGRGAATTTAELGNPVAADDYTLCIYDNPGPTRLLLGAIAPGGGTCAGDASCWVARGVPPGAKGFSYKDTGSLDPNGMKRMKLRPGADGRAKATVKGQGPNLAMPSPIAVALPMVVQLRGENGACFESTFVTAQQARPDLFKATSVSSPGVVRR